MSTDTSTGVANQVSSETSTRTSLRKSWEGWQRSIPIPDGTTVGCIDVGDGPTTLFVHGIFTSSYLWRHVIDDVRRDRRCLAPDLLGHGSTTAGAGTQLTMGTQADMLMAMLDSLGIDEIDLVGNDTGGGICQILVARYPDRIRSLLLTNCDAHDNWPPEALAPIIAIAAADGLQDVAAAMLEDPELARGPGALGDGYADPSALTDEAIEMFLRPFIEDPARTAILSTFLTTIDSAELTSIETELRNFARPTSIVWGDADSFFAPQWGRWLSETIAGAGEVVELPGAKLFFPDDYAGDLVPLLRAHWERASRQ